MEFYTQPQHETEMALYEAWLDWVACEETSEMSLPKITDHIDKGSQPTLPLTDVPF